MPCRSRRRKLLAAARGSYRRGAVVLLLGGLRDWSTTGERLGEAAADRRAQGRV